MFSVFVVCLFLSSPQSVLQARLTDDDLGHNRVATVSPFVRETLEAIEQSITERNLVDARRFFDELLPSKADGLIERTPLWSISALQFRGRLSRRLVAMEFAAHTTTTGASVAHHHDFLDARLFEESIEALTRIADDPPSFPIAISALTLLGERAAEKGWFDRAKYYWEECMFLHTLAETDSKVLELRVAALAKQVRSAATPSDCWPTLAGSASRSLNATGPLFLRDEECFSWKQSLQTNAQRVRRDSPLPHTALGSSTTVPLISDRFVIWGSTQGVHAAQIADGKSAWSASMEKSWEHSTLLFPPSGTPRSPVGLNAPERGTSCFCMHADKLYAVLDDTGTRNGSPVLVCLDLSDATQGRLEWSASAANESDYLDAAPQYSDGRVYGVVRSGRFHDLLSLVSFDADSGSLLWTVPILRCEGIASRSTCALTIAEDLIVIATHCGEIVAIHTSGTLAWRQRYSRVSKVSDKEPLPLSPAVYALGRIFVAPQDRDGLLALDKESGRLLWDISDTEEGSHAILGVTADSVVVSGRSLEWRAVQTGALRRHFGREENLGPGVGRGALIDDKVYWPTLTKLYILQSDSAESSVSPIHLDGGAIIAATPRCLVIATAQEILCHTQSGKGTDVNALKLDSDVGIPATLRGLETTPNAVQLREALR